MCVKNGRKCPGYSQSFRWSTKHEKTLSGRTKGPSNLTDLVTATSKTITQDEGAARRASDATDVSMTGEPFIELDPTLDVQSGQTQEECLDAAAEILPVGPNGALSPIVIDDLMLPEYDYGIEELLQDIWDEELPVCGPPPLDAVNNDSLFTDPILSLAPSPGPRSSSYFWDGSPFFGTGSQPFVPQIPRAINDHPSMLVEEWFRHVCSMWSSYDSDVNPNRKIALETWTRSEAVMNCLQSMSATCLSSQMPQMRRVAVSYLKKAIKAIQRDLKTAAQNIGSFPSDLLLALCCVGTAACWIDTTELGGSFLREAKTLLRRINQESDNLSEQDRHTLNFFNKSLVYWNMIVAVVSDEDDDMGIPKVTESNGRELAGPIVPHPWTGISATAQRLFAQAIKLCRRFRRHLKRDAISTMRSLQTALRDINEAQQIEEELLSLESYSVHEISETGDKHTPKSHFVDVAEGYKLASLLQLYQTFPDLVARRLPEDVTDTAGHVPWDRWIVPLSLRLVSTLQRIPPSSGTRCIQPLLYLSASTGLRFDMGTLSQQQQASQDMNDILKAANGMSLGVDADFPIFMESDGPDGEPPVLLTKVSIEVSHARRFIMERLSALEHSLPPAPVLVAKQLVQAIWDGYDSEKPGSKYTHWIDVMEDSDLRTIFG
jgi:hypothetical protein